jgi:hypothetical protein
MFGPRECRGLESVDDVGGIPGGQLGLDDRLSGTGHPDWNGYSLH